jgi:hypothetical protein
MLSLGNIFQYVDLQNRSRTLACAYLLFQLDYAVSLPCRHIYGASSKELMCPVALI